MEFGKLFGVEPKLVNKEAPTALLSNSKMAFDTMGFPKTPISQVIKWIAQWIIDEQRLLGKPTNFKVRDGKY